ncbi:hypothetical protein OEV98_13850 [Caldibacillus lycopersici]|uniref:Uncharacterized protein n=1 Tax=Perspicuibacillus lycopersici TaxID=1325689 RepID=A0AAE3LTW6_9BACI|nr:hypothetical protein [Perspicuibacillus lycopersici]MCU9614623.1 hypothetical protein [Perspicuibacillus lycopersici]
MKDYHFCATCIHFMVEKTDKGTGYRCKRLGYETHPKYKFNCWNPKEHIIKLMEKEKTTE